MGYEEDRRRQCQPAHDVEHRAAHQVGRLETFIGPVTTFLCGNTLQVKDYDCYGNWTYFDIPGKQRRHEEVFPQELAQIRELAAGIF